MLGSGSRTRLLIGLALFDLGLLALVLATGSRAIGLAGLVGHLAVTAAVWRVLPAGSRRTLVLAWMVSLPGIGLIVAFATIDHRGTGDLQQFQRGQVPERVIGPATVVRTIAGHVPVCERLVSGVSRTRRSALAQLAARRDAESIEILRWAVRHEDGELALDAALTLEELTDGFEARRALARAQLAARPSFETAVAAADVVLDVLWSGLVDDALLRALADEAGVAYARALELDPTRTAELVERRAKLALVGLRPDEALALLQPEVLALGASKLVQALYNRAVVASRQFTGSTTKEAFDAVA